MLAMKKIAEMVGAKVTSDKHVSTRQYPARVSVSAGKPAYVLIEALTQSLDCTVNVSGERVTIPGGAKKSWVYFKSAPEAIEIQNTSNSVNLNYSIIQL
ncbi:hypothetical protein QP933_06755 [Corynebacterium pseudodiphtheriticum]|uniref:hypothetical protein n=1 Tax=Corynebacterium pseudodiphtheriticum TaxID=37637 RepID=UPI002549F3E3|nr:hypothetical protein [Corynebacterium pseudodiphtheriticum]MDK8500638.1 hypothetical protein [Corynebacterium pseudodiphtheriticum]MDK8775803.1 hypothetical protein [Corynebacterium pseudodiphtheriticum]